MKYEPNFENETCPVEDIPFPAVSTLTLRLPPCGESQAQRLLLL